VLYTLVCAALPFIVGAVVIWGLGELLTTNQPLGGLPLFSE
jgi:hypothetical protein